jgi:hypothetical protein
MLATTLHFWTLAGGRRLGHLVAAGAKGTSNKKVTTIGR